MNPYPKDTKIHNLFDKILEDENLKYLSYLWVKPPHLHRLVLETKRYEFLNEYIDEYLHLYPSLINKVISSGNALILAVTNLKMSSTEETIRILLRHNENINFQNTFGTTALMYAARYSETRCNVNIIKLLLDHNANVNIKNISGTTALLYASMELGRNSNENAVKLLLEYNADVNIQDNAGYTALHYYISYVPDSSSYDALKMMLSYNVDIGIKTYHGENAISLTLGEQIVKKFKNFITK